MRLLHCLALTISVLSVTMKDLTLKWDSPVQEIVNPQFVNLDSRGGLGWLDGFSEFMCRCGLESNGHPGTDRFINNVGEEAEMELKPMADQNRHTMALLHNKSKDRAASLAWSVDELPYLTVWKNTGAVADGYVTGIEPGTNYPNNRSVEREAGRVPKLGPGESHRMTLTFALYTGLEAVEAALETVTDIGFARKAVDAPQIPIVHNKVSVRLRE